MLRGNGLEGFWFAEGRHGGEDCDVPGVGCCGGGGGGVSPWTVDTDAHCGRGGVLRWTGFVVGGEGAVGEVVFDASEGDEVGDDGSVLADSEPDLCCGTGDVFGGCAVCPFVDSAGGGGGDGADAGGAGTEGGVGAARGVR